MNNRTIAASLLIGLVSGLAGLALAGVEPSPFQPLINKLGSVENVLSAVDGKLEKILSVPPEPVHPPDPCKLADKLNRMADKLVRQNNRVMDVIESFTHPPDPCLEFKDALTKVGIKAQNIANRAERYHPPEPCKPEVADALDAVKNAAEAIVTIVDRYCPDRVR